MVAITALEFQPLSLSGLNPSSGWYLPWFSRRNSSTPTPHRPKPHHGTTSLVLVPSHLGRKRNNGSSGDIVVSWGA